MLERRMFASTSALYLQKMLLIHDCAKCTSKFCVGVTILCNAGVLCAAATFPVSAEPNLLWSHQHRDWWQTVNKVGCDINLWLKAKYWNDVL